MVNQDAVSYLHGKAVYQTCTNRHDMIENRTRKETHRSAPEASGLEPLSSAMTTFDVRALRLASDDCAGASSSSSSLMISFGSCVLCLPGDDFAGQIGL
jgi:hypothetical protein